MVIDSGFGSLYSAAQQLMFAKTKRLADHVKRVIVVSHLEAFTNQDHFPDQILVEKTGSGSRIRHVH